MIYMPTVYEAVLERLTEICKRIKAWEAEGLGTCLEIESTNYPDAWRDLSELVFRPLEPWRAASHQAFTDCPHCTGSDYVGHEAACPTQSELPL